MSEGFILTSDGQWVGPPALYLSLIQAGQDELIDGRKRVKEHSNRGLSSPIPKLTVHSQLEAVVHLSHNGHYDRAAERLMVKLPQFSNDVDGSIYKLLKLRDVKLNCLQKAVGQFRDPSKRHRRFRQSIDVVHRLRTLYRRSLEGEPIELIDLERVLGRWLHND